MRNNLIWPSLILSIVFLILAACSNEDDNFGIESEATGHRPQINSMSSSPSTINRLGTTILSCNATDADGDLMTYTWSCPSGEFPGGNSGASVIWKAPDTAGTYNISVSVSDGSGSTSDQIAIIVLGAPKAGVQGYVYGNGISTVAGAEVCFGDVCVITNAYGFYVINSALTIGEYQVTVTATGFDIYTGSRMIAAGDNIYDFYIGDHPPSAN